MSSANNQFGDSGYPPGMSSTEEGECDDRPIASQMLLKKLRQRALDRLGIPEGRERIDILTLHLLIDLKEIAQEQLKHTRIKQACKGIVDMHILHLVAGQRITHIDWVDEQNTSGIPSGDNVNEPQTKLYQIHIYNYGPGTVSYGTNRPESDFEAKLALANGENKGWEFDEPKIKTLNITATAGSALVKIITLI